MNVQLFCALADHMLAAHYAISLKDTRLADNDALVQSYVNICCRPYEVLNEIAEDANLVRTDVEGYFGVPSHAELVEADEWKALMQLGGIQLLCDQPATCPRCGARTNFEEISVDGEDYQVHTCLSSTCGHEFLAQDEEDELVES